MKFYLLNKYFKLWAIQFYSEFNLYNTKSHLLNNKINTHELYTNKYKLYNLPKMKENYRQNIKKNILLKIYWYYLNKSDNNIKLSKNIKEKIFYYLIIDLNTEKENNFIDMITDNILNGYPIDMFYQNGIILNMSRFILDCNVIQKTYYNLGTLTYYTNYYQDNLDAKEIFYDNKFHIIDDCINYHNFYTRYFGDFDIRDFYFEFFPDYIKKNNSTYFIDD